MIYWIPLQSEYLCLRASALVDTIPRASTADMACPMSYTSL